MSEKEFLQLLSENKGIIYKVVNLYAADTEEKKDLYQEILLQCWKAWPSFRREAKFSTWLYRLALNTVFTAKRKKSPIAFTGHLPDDQTLLPSSFEKEDAQRLYTAVRKLNETERAIISLHLDGYGNNEIAEIMGISNNGVNVKLFRIRERLVKILKSSVHG